MMLPRENDSETISAHESAFLPAALASMATKPGSEDELKCEIRFTLSLKNI